jgi:hypothetical protein
MKNLSNAQLSRGITIFVCFAVVLLLGVTSAVRGAAAPRPCCFTNDRYAGVCRVVPDQGETCTGILAYLNTPTSTGKTYCDSTNIRGGWLEVSCDPAKAKGQQLAVAAAAGQRTVRAVQTRGSQR